MRNLLRVSSKIIGGLKKEMRKKFKRVIYTMEKEKVNGILIIIVMGKRNVILITRMEKLMDYGLGGLKMDRRGGKNLQGWKKRWNIHFFG